MNTVESANLAHLLRTQAAARPDQVAVHFPAPRRRGTPASWTAITYAEIDAAADAYARGFVEHGIRPGDRTLLMVRPTADFYALCFGLFRAGAVPVFIDPGMGPRNAMRCVARIQPRAMVAIPPVHLVAALWRAPFRSVEVPIVAGRAFWSSAPTLASCAVPGDGPFEGPVVDADDDAVIVFTSGSTGPAKGVALSHRCMRARVARIRDMLGLQPGQVVSETLLVYTMLEVCMGLEVVLPPMDLAKPAKVDPDDVLDTMDRFRPALGSASPIVWHRTVTRALDTGRRVDGVQRLLTTGAPIPPELHEQARDVFGADVDLFTPYGATEAMPIARIASGEILADTAARTARGEGTCVGAIAEGAEVRILPITDGPIASWDGVTCLPPGEIGEIAVRGDGVSTAYREADEANAQAKIADTDGTVWHRMGDLGRVDDRGRLWFCGRKSHRIETADGLVPAVCVEGVFNHHPHVFRTAVVGLGPLGRQRVVCAVEMKPGKAWTPEVEAELEAQAAKTPWADVVARFLPHPGFPTDARHNSKIRREVVRDWAGHAMRDLVPR